jgi:adenosylmethionine-8-amino-7-oxononanoate transaminase
MNDRTKKLIEDDKRYLWHPFTQMSGWLASEPVVIERGEGFYLVDTEGRRYIDGVSSLWCNVHGHCVEAIDDAVKSQLGRIAHSTLLGLSQDRSIELAERLVNITPGGLNKVFYSDSGATSVEISLKMAFQYYHNKGSKRTKFIALENSYHGDTIGSVSLGGIGVFHGIFRELLFETMFVSAPDTYRYEGVEEACLASALGSVERLLEENDGDVAAVIVEPLVQGAAGMITHPVGFLKGVRELTESRGVLLIVDEVATGFGRTGRMFACEHEGVRPDFMCLAKGITGGYLPLAATLATDEVYEAFLGEVSEHKTFYHGHTYTGNALSCAAAIASLELFEKNNVIEGMAEKVSLVNERFGEFRELDWVGDVRGRGLMRGIEIVKDKGSKENFAYEELVGAKVCMAGRDRGVMLRPLGDVLIFMPPVGMGIELLGELLDILGDILREDLPCVVEGL